MQNACTIWLSFAEKLWSRVCFVGQVPEIPYFGRVRILFGVAQDFVLFFDGRRKSERVVKSEAVLCGKRSIQFTTAWASESCCIPDLLRTWCVSDSSGRVPVLICTGDPLTLMDPCAEIFDRYSALESPP